MLITPSAIHGIRMMSKYLLPVFLGAVGCICGIILGFLITAALARMIGIFLWMFVVGDNPTPLFITIIIAVVLCINFLLFVYIGSRFGISFGKKLSDSRKFIWPNKWLLLVAFIIFAIVGKNLTLDIQLATSFDNTEEIKLPVQALSFEKQNILEIPKNITLSTDFTDIPKLSVAGNCYAAAYIAKNPEGKEFVLASNFHAGKLYDKIVSGPYFSPSGKVFAYIAKNNDKQFVVINNQNEGPHYDEISGYPVFPPNSEEVFYVGKRGGKGFLVYNQREQISYDSINIRYPYDKSIAISDDSSTIAFSAGRDGLSFVVLGKKNQNTFEFEEQEKYVSVKNITVTPQNLYYVAAQKEGEFVILNGIKKSGSFFRVEDVLYDENSKRLIYVAQKASNGLFYIIENGKVVDTSEDFIAMTLNANGSKLAYTTTEVPRHFDVRTFVNIDGEKIGPYESIRDIQFNPKSHNIAFQAKNVLGDFVFYEGKRYEPHQIIYGFKLSPDGNNFSYFAAENYQYAMLSDKGFNAAGDMYLVTKESKRKILDNAKIEKFYGPVFVNNGNKVAYCGPDENVFSRLEVKDL